MTKAQKIAHKKGNQQRREKLLKVYYKVKPAAAGFITNPGFIQKGKYSTVNT